MSSYKIVKMNTGFGSFVYTLALNIGRGDYTPARPVKYYKTRAGAIRAIKKKGGRLER